MKLLPALLFVTMATGTLAAEWSPYENLRFGFVIDIPAGFAGNGEASNGDGQVFRSSDGTQVLRVYGGNLLADDFETSVQAAMVHAEEAGWSLSYQRVTPSWASYSGLRNGQVLYARAIALCGGQQFAAFELEYPEAEIDEMHAAVDRLVASLKAADGASC
jgi:hypothetical protein